MKNLVLVHGWAADSRIWASQREAFASRTRLWTPDLPDWEAPWLAEHLQAFDPGATILAAWSLGGMLALEACASGYNPLALILISACASFCRRPDYALGVAPAVVRGMRQRLRGAPGAVVQDFHRQLLSPGEGQWRDTLENLLPTDQDPAWLAQGLAYLGGKDLRSLLPRVKAQHIIVVHGERDRITAVAQGFFLREQLSGGRLTALPGAGHAPMVTHSAEFNDIITAFL